VTEHPLYDDVTAELGDDPLADCPDGVALCDAAVTLPTLAALDDLDDCCECDDCLALAQEAAGRPMVTLQPRGEYL
jgi:hypothetical protein